jgi:hypothetical protein
MRGTSPYQQQAIEALRSFADACQRRKQADQDMVRFRKLTVALADMLPETERSQIIQDLEASAVVGFTDTIKQIYRRAYPDGVMPLQVRATLQGMGYDLSTQSNPMASIHSVVRRLIASGEIEPNGNPDFGGYRWKQPSPGDLKRRAKELSERGKSDVPNPFGKNLREMLQEQKKK